ncbi:MAG: choice-of-anchor J domain-containing protein, partial [Bacteroidales bacterium]|nr:choice-of-anchor J domain-containing protein [Bacteroidales bacterium]
MKRFLTCLFLAATLLLPLGTRAQQLADYTVSVTQETYTSIASASRLLSSVNGDGGVQTVALPFNFVFGEQTYTLGTTLTVRPDGYVFFGTNSPGHNAKTGYEATSSNYYAIAPFFVGDGKITASGATSGAYKLDTVDANGNAMLVIEWKGLQGYHAPNGSYNYQLRLHADGSISAILGTCTGSTYSTVKHNFMLVAGTQDRICLTGSWSSPTATSVATLPDLGTALPASGTVITWTVPEVLCPRPFVSANDIALDGATLSWPSVDGASGYLVTFGTTEYSTSDTSYSLTGLNPATSYTVNVQTLCSTGDTSNPVGVTFNTLCASLTSAMLPYVQDFESAPSTGEAMPYCWTRGTTSSTSPKVNDAASNAHSPSKFLYIYTLGGIAALPPIDTTDLDITDLMLAFYARTNSNTPRLLDVGVMTDPLDNSSFQLVQQVSVESQTHELFEVPFSFFTGHGAYVAFRSVQSNNVYVDDVVLDYIPSCLRPELTISAVSSTGATLHLRDANDVNHYMVYITSGSTTDSIELNDTVYTLTNLSPISNISVSALTLCSDGTRTNLASGSFRTLCSAFEATDLPFNEDFQSTGTTNAMLSTVHDCWNVISFGSSSYLNYPQAYSSTGPDNSTRIVYFYGTAGQTEIIVGPQINTDLSDLAVYFWVRYVTNGVGITLGTMSDPTDASTFHPVHTATPPSSGWHYYDYALANAPAGDHYVAFRMDGLTSGSGGVMIDNITIGTAPTCMHPEDIAASDITTNEVTLTVNDPMHVDNYYVALLCNGDTVATTIITDSTLTIDTLSANTAYSFVVWSLCSDGTRTSELTTSFRTTCDVVTTLPWGENFNSYTWATTSASAASNVNNLPCWDFNGLYSNYTYITTSYNHDTASSGNCLRYYGTAAYPSYIVLPPFDEDLSNLMVTFWMNTSSLNAYVGVGYMTNPAEASTYTEVAQVRASTTSNWEFNDIALGSNAEGRIALRYYGSSQNIYIDDITVMLTPSCVRPSSVTVVSVDTTNATIRINDVNETN